MHQNKNQNIEKPHTPVLLSEVIHYLKPDQGESYLDLTAGYGGHANAILDRTGNYAESVLVDRDENAQSVLAEEFGITGISRLQQDYLAASHNLVKAGRQFDLILADIGVSSPHLNDGERGFSFLHEAPLDMRMDQSQALSAATIVNSYSEKELIRILKDYGEEPKARQIARAIMLARPISTTTELAAIAARSWPGHSRVHPATRTFQALRIAVNDELGQLQKALPLWLDLLAPGGRLAVISFHSLEDRLVKQAFLQAGGDRYDAHIRILTKRPVTASYTEIVHNPRARSAKLRVVVKINTKERSA
jgi:16S rRNA (cytosine1402-N4)-methyltransferase